MVDVFVLQIPYDDEEKMEEFQKIMDEYHDEMERYTKEVAKELGIEDANQIVYLRSRSRWSQELEDRIIKAEKNGHSIITLAGEEEEQLKKLGY